MVNVKIKKLERLKRIYGSLSNFDECVSNKSFPVDEKIETVKTLDNILKN